MGGCRVPYTDADPPSTRLILGRRQALVIALGNYMMRLHLFARSGTLPSFSETCLAVGISRSSLTVLHFKMIANIANSFDKDSRAKIMRVVEAGASGSVSELLWAVDIKSTTDATQGRRVQYYSQHNSSSTQHSSCLM